MYKNKAKEGSHMKSSCSTLQNSNEQLKHSKYDNHRDQENNLNYRYGKYFNTHTCMRTHRQSHTYQYTLSPAKLIKHIM